MCDGVWITAHFFHSSWESGCGCLARPYPQEHDALSHDVVSPPAGGDLLTVQEELQQD